MITRGSLPSLLLFRGARPLETLAGTAGKWANLIRAEPLTDVASVATVLARLAPEQPLVYPMIKVLLRQRTILERLLLLEFVHGVQDSDWAETDCARGQLMTAAVGAIERHIRVAALLVLLVQEELITELLDVDLH